MPRPPREPVPTGERRLSAYRRLWPLLAQHRALIAGWLFFLALSSAATLALPVAARYLIDGGFNKTDPALLNASFIGLFGVAVVMAIAGASRFWCVTLLGERVDSESGSGLAEGIDDEGRLRVRDASGNIHAWSCGEVHLGKAPA